MPYRRPTRQSTLRVANASSQGYRAQSRQKNYLTPSSGSKRHQYQAIATSAPSALLAGEYFYFKLLKFTRSAAGVTDDVPPSPTASNNYQTPTVMNGSYIKNYNAKIKIKNRGAIGGYLDVYEVALSFWDALVWNTVFPTQCPVTIDTTTTGPADLRGNISDVAMTNALISKNTNKNHKFLQHYMKPRGTIFVTNEDGGNGGEVTININRVPAKCRRSQTGMFWALYFHNDSDSNGAETLALDATIDVSFEEVPSDNRLPYID